MAAVKAPEVAQLLLDAGVAVDCVVTEAGYRLLQALYRGARPWDALAALAESRPSPQPALRIWRDADEWDGYAAVGDDTVLHVELAKRNQLLLLAPLCANTLANAALGLCPNLLGCVLRAWYYDLDAAFAGPIAARCGAHSVARPVLAAPAMNTVMWYQKVTRAHVEALEARGVKIVPPVAKTLACGDLGMGAMATPPEIVREAVELLRRHAAAEAVAEVEGRPRFEI